MIPETKFIAILAKLAPISGGVALVASIQASINADDPGGWAWMWRLGLTAALTVFMTLCGILYRDLREGLRRGELIRIEQHKENSAIILDLASKQQRMIGVLAMLPMMMAKDSTTEEMFRYVQEIQKVLER